MLSDVIGTRFWMASNVRCTLDGPRVLLTFKLKRGDSAWTGGDVNTLLRTPPEFGADYFHWVTVEPRFGMWFSIDKTGVVQFGKASGFATVGVGQDVDMTLAWHRA